MAKYRAFNNASNSCLPKILIVENMADCCYLVESNYNNFNAQWSDILQNVNIEEFVDIPRPATILPSTAKELDLFSLIFPAELFGKIADETNNYVDREDER